jgi:hypothetical protein
MINFPSARNALCLAHQAVINIAELQKGMMRH